MVAASSRSPCFFRAPPVSLIFRLILLMVRCLPGAGRLAAGAGLSFAPGLSPPRPMALDGPAVSCCAPGVAAVVAGLSAVAPGVPAAVKALPPGWLSGRSLPWMAGSDGRTAFTDLLTGPDFSFSGGASRLWGGVRAARRAFFFQGRPSAAATAPGAIADYDWPCAERRPGC